MRHYHAQSYTHYYDFVFVVANFLLWNKPNRIVQLSLYSNGVCPVCLRKNLLKKLALGKLSRSAIS